MKLSLGPVLFYWDRQQTLDFYANMAEQPLDVIYLGETVCSKRRAMMRACLTALNAAFKGIDEDQKPAEGDGAGKAPKAD